MDKEYYWLYFKDNICIKHQKESNGILHPIVIIQLKSQNIFRQLALLSNDFNPVGKNKEELKEFLT